MRYASSTAIYKGTVTLWGGFVDMFPGRGVRVVLGHSTNVIIVGVFAGYFCKGVNTLFLLKSPILEVDGQVDGQSGRTISA